MVMAKRKKKRNITNELKQLNDRIGMMRMNCETMEQYQKKKEEEVSNYTKNCRLVFDYMANRKIKQIKVTFDGCGDSGQMTDFTTDSKDNDEGLFNELVPFSTISSGTEWDATKKTWVELPSKEGTLRELLEEIACDKLGQDHSGWEINSGSFGEFVFDIKKRKLTLEFNERYEEVNTSEDEETF